MGGPTLILLKDEAMDAYEFIDCIDYDRMKVCRTCGHVYGFWTYRPEILPRIPERWQPERTYYQKCGRHCPELNTKQEMPEEDREQERWPMGDFNTAVELCYCCGEEVLHSGTRWSCWFCPACLRKVVTFNTTYQATIIPVGRHSIMAGYAVRPSDGNDKAKLTEFVRNMGGLFDRIEALSRWAADRVRMNLERIGSNGDAGLPHYLTLMKERTCKEEAFRGLVRYMREAIA